MKRTLLAVLTAGSLLLAAGCGDDADGNEGTAAPTGTAPAATPAGAPFVLGAIGGYTGNQAASAGLVDDVSKAWEKAVNARGGINGHPVKLIVKDDAGDPAKALQAAKELIEQEKVVAIVGHHSLVSSSWTDYAQAKGVPVIGGVPIETPALSSPNVYPSGTNAVTMIVGQFQAMKAAGLTKMGILYCAESPVCAQLEGLSRAAASIVGGVEVVSAGKVAATQPSFNAECLALKNKGADALFVASGAPVVVRVTQACAKLGVKPVQVNQSSTASTEWLGTPELDGALLVSPNANYVDAAIPAVKEFQDAIDAYDDKLRDSAQFSSNTIWSWAAGELFEKVATTASLSPTSTSADIAKALATVKQETLEGLAPPLTFVAGAPTFVSCWFDLTVKDGEFVTTNDGKTTCLTAEQGAALGKILAGG